MYVIIDRFEGEFAVVETPERNMYNIPRQLLPGCGEGDRILIKKSVDDNEEFETAVRDMFVD